MENPFHTRSHLMSIIAASIGLLARIIITINFKDTLRQRVEITTPTTDWKRVNEAIYLLKSGLDPYSGNIFHEYPVSLNLYRILSIYFNIDYVFALADVTTAYLLSTTVFKELKESGHEEKFALSRSWIVYMIYLFSPLSIISCAGQTTAIFTNLLIAGICYSIHLERSRALTSFLMALLVCNNIHFVILVPPMLMNMENQTRKKYIDSHHNKKNSFYSLMSSSKILLLSLLALLIISYNISGNSVSFIKGSYIFSLKIHDLKPNIGLAWYFLTEMFEHFTDFFTWLAQINAFIHTIPITICLREKPFFAFYITLLLATIFQPYPSLVHVNLSASLIPCFLNLFSYTKHGLKISCALISSLSLMPVFWHLWIIMGTANSNFYFGTSLVFSTSLIFLMIDLLNADGFQSAKKRYDRNSEIVQSTQ